MALASYQKISRVLPGQPFGDGRNGAKVISSNTTQSPKDESCSGTSGNKSLSVGSTSISNNDVVIIHQTRGTGAGQWEVNKVVSGGGTTSLTLAENKAFTYTDGGSSQAQAIRIPMYTAVTVNSSRFWTAKSWGGDVGGILLFACNGTTTVTGTIRINGASGSGSTPGSSGGYYGANTAGKRGEGVNAARNVTAYTRNGNAAGGGFADGGNAAGGGGGNGSSGTAGNYQPENSTQPGQGGTIAGNSQLTNMVFGGGGGSSDISPEGGGGTPSGGAAGGAAIFIYSRVLTITGSATTTGGNGGTNVGVVNYGGSGAGGSIFMGVQTATLGTNKAVATGGIGEGAFAKGGNGRIALHYGSSYTGTTNPTLTATKDSSLLIGGGAFIFNLV